jgi:DNA-binding transcriptional MerR regulator
MSYKLTIRSRDDEPVYTRLVAAQLAQVSLDFLCLCEEEGLIQVQGMAGGGQGYSVADIRHLVRIHRLHEDVGLDLPAVEVTLNLRRQVLDLMAQIEELERRMAQREQELLDEIGRLRRRQAVEADWRW